MTSLSDTLTVGLVLVLLFGSVALYLYTRIQQAEQKISLLESILLDLKMSTEIKSYTELPAHEDTRNTASSLVDSNNASDEYAPFEEVDTNNLKSSSRASSVHDATSADIAVDEYKSVIAEAIKEEEPVSNETTTNVSANYEAMTIKELQNLAKSRNITGAGSMKKGQIIEALKTSDRFSSNSIEPGSVGTDNGSFLETSGSFLEKDTK
jgi:hypothetical protein